MAGPPVSVIVVSRGRPDDLSLCLTGLSQLDYDRFEIVVVADPSGIAAIDRAGLAGRVKPVAFDKANISAARNLGLRHAAGDVVAFIDDDAVPEPTWLARLAAPFAAPEVAAAGGYVRGRNGISFQNTARRVDALGRHTPLTLPGDAPQLFASEPGDAVKTEGTNCAFRRDLLMRMGGFDPAYRFYLDETDLNLRLADHRLLTAIVPLAQVHHGFSASSRRHASRMPKTLHEIGASTMVLLRKRAMPAEREPALEELRAEQRVRLLRHMVAGTCEPRDVPHLMDTLDAGLAEGEDRTIGPLPRLEPADAPFLRFDPPTRFTGHEAICGRSIARARLERRARSRVAGGTRVSLFLFSPTALYHRVRFVPEGYWQQTGGVFGRADRSQPLFRWYTLTSRCSAEVRRVAKVRGLND